MTDTVTAKLAEWEALTERATEGPWLPSVRHPFDHGRRAVAVGHGEDHGAFRAADAEFIAAAREMVPALIGFVREVLELHPPYPVPQKMVDGTIVACSECGSVDDAPVEWPCPTVQALTKRIGGA